jgi:gliding motility-associated-like protein
VYGAVDPGSYLYTVSPSLTGLASLTGSLTRVVGENVGTYSISQNDLTTANNPNYDITYVGNNFTITKLPLTITANVGQTKVYGAVDPASYGYSLSAPLLGGDVLIGALSRVTGEAVGTYAIGQGTLTNSNYDITFIGNDFTITKKALTVTATALDKIYDGNTLASVSLSSTDIVSGDIILIANASATFDTKEIGINKIVTVSGMSISGLNVVNYSLTSTSVTTTASISAPATIIFDLPNAFTPNGDGMNDELKLITNAGVTSLTSFKIFSRSGNLVFESRDLSRGWDGRYKGNILPIDVYYWTAAYVDRNNVTNSKTGTVLLLK